MNLGTIEMRPLGCNLDGGRFSGTIEEGAVKKRCSLKGVLVVAQADARRYNRLADPNVVVVVRRMSKLPQAS